ncbi:MULTISPECIES: ABC1 kinase family protein [Limnochorda]|uniref:ABC1 kinase family protein n=1 Tax=Limnochorda TaxID=1676651 RepID=UPI0026EA383F|nr:AarF/ABC1/UbiB kinase family protein [Limnochorda pilosa]
MGGEAPLGPLARRRRLAGRYRQVAEVLGRYGFGLLLEELGLERFRPGFRRREERVLQSRGARLRQALEELGPTFIKLGQFLSTRPDLVPPDILDELQRLQDQVPPVPFQVLEPALRDALGGRPLDQVFRSLDPEPLASASIAQVHAGVLHDGAEVAIKIQRPQVQQLIATDLELLTALAHLAAGRLHLPFDPVALVDALAHGVRQELDYLREGRTIERFQANFQGWAWVHFPRVYWAWSSRQVLVMERLRGWRITDLEALDRAGIDRRLLARRGAQLFMKMVLVDGFFHGDPHPGNLYVEPGNRLAVMDFGIVGRIDEETIEGVVSLLQALVDRRPQQAVQALDALGALDAQTDQAALRRDLGELIDTHWGRTLAEVSVGETVAELLRLIHRHRIHLPSELFLLAKVLVGVEGLGRQLDPSFNVVEVAAPFVRRLMTRRLAPSRVGRRVWEDLSHTAALWGRLPQELAGLATQARQGRLRLQVDPRGLDAHARRIERAVRELGVSVVFAATLLALVFSLWVAPGPHLAGVPLLTWFLLALLAFLGALLFISLFRR